MRYQISFYALFALLAACQGGGTIALDNVSEDEFSAADGDTITIEEDIEEVGESLDLVPDTAPPEPGKFGAPCQSNQDCESGFCIEGISGFFCTQICTEECPSGWLCRATFIGSDVISLCVPIGARLCKECKFDEQCGDGLCLDTPEGKVCGRDCTFMACPVGYRCVEVDTANGGKAKQCLPMSGVCSCNVLSDGMKRPCVHTNEIGTCLGFETCDMNEGWIGCTAREPAKETCNGIDDDCNGVADDGLKHPVDENNNPIECRITIGELSCPGQWVCRGEDGWDCVGQEPRPETCDYIDNDCDGVVDQPFKIGEKYVDSANCGQCGVDCAKVIPFAKETACDPTPDTPKCVVIECEPGYFKVGDSQCVLQISNLCMPCIDDTNCGASGNLCVTMGSGKFCGRDCSPGSPFGIECPAGYECKDLGSGVMQCIPTSGTCDCTPANHGTFRVCMKEVAGVGKCYGTEVCDSSQGWVGCTAKTPMKEVCNGLDDDCNGLTDDNVEPPKTPCERTWHDPQTGKLYSCSAPWTCEDDGTGVKWVCKAKQPGPETCNYQDDNCDGQIDEDFKLEGTNKYNDLDNCGACGISCVGMVPHGTAKCDAIGPQPRCVVDKCDPGYYKASDLSCIALPDTACMPCTSNKTCQIPGDVCIPMSSTGATYCIWDCSPQSLHPPTGPNDSRCPPGYFCLETDSSGAPFYKCLPMSGVCDCLAQNAGQTRVCYKKNAAGTCYGTETCDPQKGWSACTAPTPSTEKCNGLDDNCNGLTDETFLAQGLGAVCSTGLGECRRIGVLVCNATQDGVECNAPVISGVPEKCNNLDDDCDGEIDEDFPNKGKVCSIGVGECSSNGVFICNTDGSGLECNAPIIQPGIEVCDGLDNDCDGLTDEDPIWSNKGKICEVGQGICRRTGVWQCSVSNPAGPLECSATPGVPTTEVCNGLDDDCDGLTDEDALWANKGKVCKAGQGICEKTGVWQCSVSNPAGPLECSATPGVPTTEVCNGLDDDCDGLTDEDALWANKGKVCKVGQGICERAGVWQCSVSNPAGPLECSATPGTPSTEVCDYIDNDCDGITDNGFQTGGKYISDIACGNCFTNCTEIYAKPNAYGVCDATGAMPECKMRCNQPPKTPDYYFNLNQIPDDGCEFRLDPAAIYVSVNDPAAADDSTCGNGPVGTGSGNHPCKSITYGLTRTGGIKTKLLVADGLYQETITLISGISLYGGYRADTWERHLSSTLTIIRGTQVTPHAKTIIGVSINAPTIVEGFRIEGASPTAAQGNSYAVWLKNCTSALQMNNNIIVAGDGRPGTKGGDGAAGQGGTNGSNGLPTVNMYAAVCYGDPANGYTGNVGGAGGARTCMNPGGGTTVVNGGKGGYTSCPARNRQEGSGASGSGPNPGAGGAGGWGHNTSGSSCSPTPGQLEVGINGGAGGNGTDGSGGPGATSADGVVIGDEWVGNSGIAGSHGGHGSGGGGGGGGGGNNLANTSYDDFGGSGGGGGSGGCAGWGGQAGTAGGGSFAVFVTFTGAGPSSVSDIPMLTGNTIRRGLGGDGGLGGNGGAGGAGGAGGSGGPVAGYNGPIYCIFGGANGGPGGRGGHGGGGGGGAGGVSWDIFVYNINAVNPPWTTTNTFPLAADVDTGGKGGSGGLSLNTTIGIGGNGVSGSYGRMKLIP